MAAEERWKRDDIVVCDNCEYMDTATFATTGDVVWKAAHRLVDYLEATADETGLSRPGVNVLELGSGTGWLGMVLAQNLRGAKSVCVTEMEAGGALAWLRRNVEKNKQQAAQRGVELWPEGRLTTAACDWNEYQVSDDAMDPVTAAAAAADAADAADDDPAPAASPDTPAPHLAPSPPPPLDAVPWDFIVGSDLVYNEVGVFTLPRVVRALLTRSKLNGAPGPVAIYAHTKYRFETMDVDFFDALDECGLAREEVREPGAPSPPASPERYSELYPEKRIAVFRITLKESID